MAVILNRTVRRWAIGNTVLAIVEPLDFLRGISDVRLFMPTTLAPNANPPVAQVGVWVAINDLQTAVSTAIGLRPLVARFREWASENPNVGRFVFGFKLTCGLILAAFVNYLTSVDVDAEPDRWLKWLTLSVVLGINVIGLEFLDKGLEETYEEKLKRVGKYTVELEYQRDTLLNFQDCVRELVKAKICRAKSLFERKNRGALAYFNAQQCDLHINTALCQLHQMIEELNAGSQNVRVALFAKEKRRDTDLKPKYAWNGSSHQFIQNIGKENYRVDVQPPPSLISEFYQELLKNSEKPSMTVPACSKHLDMKYFSPDQKRYLKSVLLCRGEIYVDGKPDFFILSIDSDVEGFFDEANMALIDQFLPDMVLRMEYELLVRACLTDPRT